MPPALFSILPLASRHMPACAEIAKTAPDPWTLPQLCADMSRSGFTGFVLAAPQAVAGFCILHILENSAELALIAVAPQHRRQGVADALLHHSFAQLKAQGVTHCLLEVRASNKAAVSLYKKLGFTTLARRKNLYSNPPEDGFTMQKQFL